MKLSIAGPVRLACLAGVLLAACDGPTESPAGPPAAAEIVSGDLQTGVAGQELAAALEVRVLDARGRPLPGRPVTFRVTAGNGTVFLGSTTTDASGLAADRWTLGTVAGDTQRVEARTVDAATGNALSATFRAVARPDAPASVVALDSAFRHGTTGQPLADSLRVVVRDRYQNPVPGATVTWTAIAGGGSVAPATALTGATGVAAAQWTLGPRTDSVQAAQAAVGSATARFTAQAAVPAGAVLQRVLTVPGHVTDFEPAARVLYVDTTASPRLLKLRNGGADTTASRASDGTPVEAWALLSPAGAIYGLSRPFPFQQTFGAFELRNGAIVDLQTNLLGTLRVAGSWAAWGDGDRVWRRALVAGTTDSVPTRQSQASDVAANGDVVFYGGSATPGSVVRWRSGALAVLGPGLAPLTDGTLVVWMRGTWPTVEIDLYTGTGVAVLSPPGTYSDSPPAGQHWGLYAVDSGYVAFTRTTADPSVAELWLRSPSGALTRVSAACTVCEVLAVGTAGEVVYRSGAELFVWRAGIAPTDVGAHRGKAVWRSGAAYLLEGGSVYRLSF